MSDRDQWDELAAGLTKKIAAALREQAEAHKAEVDKWRKLNDDQRMSDAAYYSKMILARDAELADLRAENERWKYSANSKALRELQIENNDLHAEIARLKSGQQCSCGKTTPHGQADCDPSATTAPKEDEPPL